MTEPKDRTPADPDEDSEDLRVTTDLSFEELVKRVIHADDEAADEGDSREA